MCPQDGSTLNEKDVSTVKICIEYIKKFVYDL